jgi:hypothetical protein
MFNIITLFSFISTTAALINITQLIENSPHQDQISPWWNFWYHRRAYIQEISRHDAPRTNNNAELMHAAWEKSTGKNLSLPEGVKFCIGQSLLLESKHIRKYCFSFIFFSVFHITSFQEFCEGHRFQTALPAPKVVHHAVINSKASNSTNYDEYP